ncbi:Sir2-type regulatory protein [Bifidobacterium actinocoloniiforme DSM 22766]|uniref:protein acetyllysine N-acetyltransferase n=1 Tax=Bifidobacterium actinocoloniiforme DSM 22766 TaxID=1437605 RepID=A0A086YWH4_9BIFI|nr:Sir2 family NAD-dependent protein deacetylase [Bifidobacterium actinocoloniiforme]AKV55816.1 NAD-dependent deacetylase [Bifidobacterium actinocoloniiforme DSM 22766]KFI38624.1 Sir2-type regulatory protein [Bifidobacterium actinocoloniiforme DSM 22766]
MSTNTRTKRIAVLTGAGISTSAGIPDFRGPDGVWTKHPDQMQVYDLDAFLTNKRAREYSWRWQKESPVWTAQPGVAHRALVKLEEAGTLTLLATQNFDALHEKAGNSPELIVNLHGTIGSSHCMKCGAAYRTSEIMDRLDQEPDPHCRRPLPYQGDLPCGGIIKTDVVYFGEALPDGAMEKSLKEVRRADELWVIGSTLEVFPAASLVPAAAQAEVPITIMNMGRTQYDGLAQRLIRGPIQDALPELVDETITRSKRQR